MEGFQSHPKNFKDNIGTEAASDDQKLKILSDHYHKVFNNHAPIDQSVNDEIPQHPIQH